MDRLSERMQSVEIVSTVDEDYIYVCTYILYLSPKIKGERFNILHSAQ